MAKENKKRKGNLKYSILLLLLIAILLITSTYAWFTANQVVSVGTLDVQVQAANGLQISVDAHTWKTSISKQEILDASYTGVKNQIPDELTAVSSAKEVDSGLLNMFLGTITSDDGGAQTLTATKETDGNGAGVTTGNYIAFNMFLRVDQETEIVLTETSGVTFVDTDRGLQNSARVAFINEGNVPDAGQESTIQPMMNGDSALIWEPNNDSHNNSAITHANQNYGQTITDGQVVPYVGVAQAIADGIPLADTITADDTNFKSVTVDMPSGSDGIGEEGLDFITLQPGVTKIRVYMWIEGQDYDCENGASGSNIAFNMEFAIKQGAGA